MKWLWFSLVVAALVGCEKTDAMTQLTPLNPIPGAGGAGGSGAGGAAAPDPLKCETIPPTVTPAMLHAEAAAVLAVPMGGTCNFSSCHVPPRGEAMLVLASVADLNAQLVGKMSCQAPTVPLVAAGGGDAALQNSWLWLKLTAPTDPQAGNLVPNPAWGPGGVCGTTPSAPFGGIMPRNATMMLAENRLGPIRRWICGGAPGPQ